MITLTRLLARQLKAMIRKTFSLGARGGGPPVVLETDAGGLTVRAQTDQAALEYHEPGVLPPERLVVPYMLLVDCEGTQATPVAIEKSGKQQVACQFQEKQVPVLVNHDVLPLPEKLFPPRPANLLLNEPPFLADLCDVMETTDSNHARYALGCAQLRGGQGKMVATNGHNLLVRSGCLFPWQEDVLVVGTKVFGQRELPADLPIHVGKSEDFVTFVAGRWTIHLAIEKEGRYPQVESELREPQTALTSLQISSGDAKFLLDNLQHLPFDEFSTDQPVTVDLNGSVAVRAKSQEQKFPMELVLTNSHYAGEAAKIHTDRRFLSRALRMGLLDMSYFGAATALQCVDARRRYVWMPLDPEGAIGADAKAVRIESPPENGSPSPIPSIRNSPVMRKKKQIEPAAPEAVPATNGHVRPEQPVVAPPPPPVAPVTLGSAATNGAAEPRDAAGSAIEQALAVRDSLRGALAQTAELVATLRREKKQARLVAATLASLKELQTVS